jgi:hypothetical protein
MSMWFYDEAEEMEDYQAFKREVLRLESEYLEYRALLRDAEKDLRADPEDENLKARVNYFIRRLKDLERQGPWLSSDLPLEYALWGPPHG